MCKVLGVKRGNVYYTKRVKKSGTELEHAVISEFLASRHNYGTRKIKEELNKKKTTISRRKIALIMAKFNLVSKYTLKRYKSHKKSVNNEAAENILNRKFNGRKPMEVVISDLTYVRVGNDWNYVCFLIDLSAREIIGHAAGKKKDAEIVKKAFYSVKANLSQIEIFHTDRGSEFKNSVIDEIIKTFDVKRSLSRKGNPYDNAVAESTYNILKTEFVFGEKFDSFEELEFKLFDYVNWFNTRRIHSSLGYLTPQEYKLRLQVR